MSKSKKILILGSTGMLGQALVSVGKIKNYDTFGASIENADFNIDIRDEKNLKNFLENNNFDVVINTCAYVNHKFCDENFLEAYNLNSRPSAILSDLALKNGFKYVYVSTDGYYNGDGNKKHTEEDDIKLLNEYARTKYIGECYTLTNKNALVVRTNIVGFRYEKERPTFVEWVINSLEEKKEMTLFNDYYTSSISVNQFSHALYSLIEADISGRINLASSQISSKEDFITTLAKHFDFDLSQTRSGSVRELSSSYRADSLGLDVSKAEKILGYTLPNLEDVILDLKREYYDVCKKN